MAAGQVAVVALAVPAAGARVAAGPVADRAVAVVAAVAAPAVDGRRVRAGLREAVRPARAAEGLQTGLRGRAGWLAMSSYSD